MELPTEIWERIVIQAKKTNTDFVNDLSNLKDLISIYGVIKVKLENMISDKSNIFRSWDIIKIKHDMGINEPIYFLVMKRHSNTSKRINLLEIIPSEETTIIGDFVIQPTDQRHNDNYMKQIVYMSVSGIEIIKHIKRTDIIRNRINIAKKLNQYDVIKISHFWRLSDIKHTNNQYYTMDEYNAYHKSNKVLFLYYSDTSGAFILFNDGTTKHIDRKDFYIIIDVMKLTDLSPNTTEYRVFNQHIERVKEMTTQYHESKLLNEIDD